MNLWLYGHQSKHRYCILHKYLVPTKFVIRLHPYIPYMDRMDSWSSLRWEDEFFGFLLRISFWYPHPCKIFPSVFSSIYFLFQIWELNKKYKNQMQPLLVFYQGINKKEKVWSKVQERNSLPYWLQQLISNLQKR